MTFDKAEDRRLADVARPFPQRLCPFGNVSAEELQVREVAPAGQARLLP